MLTAEMLIQSTNTPFNQIAEYVGYNSYSGFYNAFRQYFGVAPKKNESEINKNNQKIVSRFYPAFYAKTTLPFEQP